MNKLDAVPFTIKDEIASRARMGLIALATDHVIEHELGFLMQDIKGAQLYTTKVPMESCVTPETLSAMNSRLTSAARTLLPGNTFDVVGYGCTSASVVIGEEEVMHSIHAACPGVKITTPITACLAALETFNAKTICLLTPYIEDVNVLIREYFEARGIDVAVCATFAEINDNRAGMITPESIRDAVTNVFSAVDADLIFISCTSLRAAQLVPELESILMSNVTTSNHALAWHMLRLAGIDDKMPEKGKLFSSQIKVNN